MNRNTARLLVAVGVLMLGLVIWSLPGDADLVVLQRTAFDMDVPWSVATVSIKELPDTKLPVQQPDPQQAQVQIALPRAVKAGLYTVVLASGQAGTQMERSLRVINPWQCSSKLPWLPCGSTAGLGILLVFVFSVPAFFRPGNLVRPWAYLLEEGGELSLGRVQLAIWLVPAVVIYGSLMVFTERLMALPPSLASILTGSVLTSLVSATVTPIDKLKAPAAGPQAVNQPQPAMVATAVAEAAAAQEAPAAAAPAARVVPADRAPGGTRDRSRGRLVELVEDWNGQGDLSRYQYLFLSAMGAAMLLVQFYRTWQVPEVPNDLLGLLAAGAMGYVGTKVVKHVRGSN